MKIAPFPQNEKERQLVLNEYNILDTPTEKQFDDLILIASHICKAPIALITLIDESRQWFKAKKGIDGTETTREVSFCSHAILQDDVLIVPNALKDERFSENPFVTGPANVQFYAGAPLKTPGGHRIGTLCVVDNAPRDLDANQILVLESLAREVVNLLELRKKVAQLQKAEQALKIARDEANQLASNKGDFIANISHEIRTPMNGIIGVTELLMDTKLDPEQRDKVEIIQATGRTLLSLINDVLDFSKIESGKMNLESVPFDLHEATSGPIKMLQVIAQKKGLALTYSIDAQVPRWIESDVIRYQQILTNLVVNGIKFTLQGGVHIDIMTQSKPNGRLELHVRVKDTGIGIPIERQSQLFKSFSQAHLSTAREFGGTGLGLAISKSLCENMNGKIWLNSEVGKGTTFEFTLEVRKTESLKTVTTESPVEVENLATTNPLNVLIAEDNNVNRIVITAYLRKLGYQADAAENGLVVLAMAEKKDYDLILMDCHMPELDGVEATRVLIEKWNKQGYSQAEQPAIVALTASALEEDKKRCMEVGMRSFLMKPLLLNDLRNVLQNCKPIARKKRKSA